MCRPYVDIMIISLTVNWTVLCFNIVPKLQLWVSGKKGNRWPLKTTIKVCKYFHDRPQLLSRIVTEQLVVWCLVLLSLIAISAGDVIKQPFAASDKGSWRIQFVEVVFAINIGRYLFSITGSVLSKQQKSKVKFRTDVIHHMVTLTCYSIFLSYGENTLLGLIGILTEVTTLFDEVGRILKDGNHDHTVLYKRLVVIACVSSICFRGIIPTTFLIIAMFQQSPFAMNNLTLMVFFLSIIFFSVINVWQILSNIQRLLKYTIEKSRERYDESREIGTVADTGTRQLKYSKNNLGYCRPYNNKNLYGADNEKYNLNNKKDTVKESIKLQLCPEAYFIGECESKTKTDETNNTIRDSTSQQRRHHRFDTYDDLHYEQVSESVPQSPLSPFGISNGSSRSDRSSDTTGSDSVLIPERRDCAAAKDDRVHHSTGWLESISAGRETVPVHFYRSLSMTNLNESNH